MKSDYHYDIHNLLKIRIVASSQDIKYLDKELRRFKVKEKGEPDLVVYLGRFKPPREASAISYWSIAIAGCLRGSLLLSTDRFSPDPSV